MDVALACLIAARCRTGIHASNAPETSSFLVSETTYTVNVTDPTPEPSDEDPFGEPQRFPTPKRHGNNGITKRRSKTEAERARMP